MEIPDRVHIAPLGYEHDRVVKPALELKAEVIYLLEHDEPEHEKPPYHQEAKEELRDAGLEVQTKVCNIFDLYDVLGGVASIASERPEDKIYVNVSSGSKISAIGAMIACMATEAATPYYVSPEGYTSSDLSDPVTYGMENVEDLPTYPIDAPRPEQIAILEFIDAQGEVTKSDLIEFGSQAELPFIVESEAASEKAKYRLLESHIIEPLADDGYVEIREVGRQRRVSLTKAGENALQAFSYLGKKVKE